MKYTYRHMMLDDEELLKEIAAKYETAKEMWLEYIDGKENYPNQGLFRHYLAEMGIRDRRYRVYNRRQSKTKGTIIKANMATATKKSTKALKHMFDENVFANSNILKREFWHVEPPAGYKKVACWKKTQHKPTMPDGVVYKKEVKIVKETNKRYFKT